MRTSITPTYSTTDTGPRYHVTTLVHDRTVTFRRPIDDPFVRSTVTVSWPDLLRGLLRGHLDVTVVVGADPEMIEDVLELNADYRGLPGSTRRTQSDQELRQTIQRFGRSL
ncbi:hypothetical protein [Actinomadura miaoliensis]|uniref:Uncharacterized protein n=1 Tax=Actinomadura miaoliensis TaxID=430685 RepID=A0ABP7W7E5_9ACTN